MAVQAAGGQAAGSAAPFAAAAAATTMLAFVPKGVLTELLTSGISVGCANTATNPLGESTCRFNRRHLENGSEWPSEA